MRFCFLLSSLFFRLDSEKEPIFGEMLFAEFFRRGTISDFCIFNTPNRNPLLFLLLYLN